MKKKTFFSYALENNKNLINKKITIITIRVSFSFIFSLNLILIIFVKLLLGF